MLGFAPLASTPIAALPGVPFADLFPLCLDVSVRSFMALDRDMARCVPIQPAVSPVLILDTETLAAMTLAADRRRVMTLKTKVSAC